MTDLYLLDQNDINWTNPGYQKLRDVLSKAFAEGYIAQDLLKMAGIEQRWLPASPVNMYHFWNVALPEVATQGKLRALVEAALKNEHTAGYRDDLQSFLEYRLPAGATPATGPQPEEAGLLPLRQLAGLPFDALPHGVQALLQTFEAHRQAYDERLARQHQ